MTRTRPGKGARMRHLDSSPLQGGGREGGPAPAHGGGRRLEGRRFRHRDPSAGRAAGVRRRSGDPVQSAEPGSSPLPTSPLPGGRSATGRTRERPRRRTGRRTAAAFSPPPWKGGREEGPTPVRGHARRLEGRRFRHREPLGGSGGRGAEAVGRPPVRAAEPGSSPLPASPLPGGRSATGRTRERPRRRTRRRTAAASSPPPSRGEETAPTDRALRGERAARSYAFPQRGNEGAAPMNAPQPHADAIM